MGCTLIIGFALNLLLFLSFFLLISKYHIYIYIYEGIT